MTIFHILQTYSDGGVCLDLYLRKWIENCFVLFRFSYFCVEWKKFDQFVLHLQEMRKISTSMFRRCGLFLFIVYFRVQTNAKSLKRNWLFFVWRWPEFTIWSFEWVRKRCDNRWVGSRGGVCERYSPEKRPTTFWVAEEEDVKPISKISRFSKSRCLMFPSHNSLV